MPTKVQRTLYECNICHAVCESEAEAVQCERAHREIPLKLSLTEIGCVLASMSGEVPIKDFLPEPFLTKLKRRLGDIYAVESQK